MKVTKRISSLLLIGMLGGTGSARAGHEEGNGGDSLALAFVKDAKELVRSLAPQKSELPFDLAKLTKAINTTYVTSTDDVLELKGAVKDAINYPGLQTIVFNRKRWQTMANENVRKALVLHEYLGVIGVDDKNYDISTSWVLRVRNREAPVGEFALVGAIGKLVAFDTAKDSSDLVMASEDGRVLIWDLETRTIRNMIKSEIEKVDAVSLLREEWHGRTLLAVAGSGQLEIWNLEETHHLAAGTKLATISLPRGMVNSLKLSERKIADAEFDVVVLVGGPGPELTYLVENPLALARVTQLKVAPHEVGQDFLYEVDVTNEGKLGSVVSSPQNLRLWDLTKPALVKDLEVPSRSNSALFSETPDLMLTGGYDGVARIVNVAGAKAEVVKTYTLSDAQEYSASEVAWGPDEKSVIVVATKKAGSGAFVEIFDAISTQRVGRVDIPAYSDVRVDAKRKLLFVSQDNKVIAWALPNLSAPAQAKVSCKLKSGEGPYQSFTVTFDVKDNYLASNEVVSFDSKIVSKEKEALEGLATHYLRGEEPAEDADTLNMGEVEVLSVSDTGAFAIRFGYDSGDWASDLITIRKDAEGNVTAENDFGSDGPEYRGSKYTCTSTYFRPVGAH